MKVELYQQHARFLSQLKKEKPPRWWLIRPLPYKKTPVVAGVFICENEALGRGGCLLGEHLVDGLQAAGAECLLGSAEAAHLEVGELLALGGDVRVAARHAPVGAAAAAVTKSGHNHR